MYFMQFCDPFYASFLVQAHGVIFAIYPKVSHLCHVSNFSLSLRYMTKV